MNSPAGQQMETTPFDLDAALGLSAPLKNARPVKSADRDRNRNRQHHRMADLQAAFEADTLLRRNALRDIRLQEERNRSITNKK